jgi:hypothetical protein
VPTETGSIRAETGSRLIALWHYAKDGVIPEGAKMKTAQERHSSRTISGPRPAVAVVPTRTRKGAVSQSGTAARMPGSWSGIADPTG